MTLLGLLLALLLGSLLWLRPGGGPVTPGLGGSQAPRRPAEAIRAPIDAARQAAERAEESHRRLEEQMRQLR
jgi:hypothetical protein